MDIVELAQRMGIELVRQGSSYHARQDKSLVFFPRRNNYKQFGSGSEGQGDPIALLQNLKGLSFKEAVHTLAGQQGLPAYAPPAREQRNKPFSLPPRHESTSAVYAYLRHRGICKSVIDACVQNGLIYQSADKYQSTVYTGITPNGEYKFAALESSMKSIPEGKRRFKMDVTGSQKAYSFCIPAATESSRLVVCESPVDALSCASVVKRKGQDWQSRHYLSLGGTSDAALKQYLNGHPEILQVSLCLDNDRAGQEAAQKMKADLESKGYNVNIAPPSKDKDYNDLLLSMRQRQQENAKAPER